MSTKQIQARPRVLIEEWLPIAKVGAECMRERGASSALPPLYFLHVWWARRPLTISRAAILASVLPAWSADWPAPLKKHFPSREAYHDWFVKLLGIFGDPVKAQRLLAEARRRKVKIPNPYDSPRAFSVNPDEEQLQVLRQVLEHTWGKADLSILDPMAGGGSIPFEARRYGFATHANDLNPVAALIEKATLDYPFRFGAELARDIEKYGRLWISAVQKRLKPFFSHVEDPRIEGVCYLWARTVTCPDTKKPVPLSPNWWIVKNDTAPVCVKLLVKPNWDRCRFEVVEGVAGCEAANPEQGTQKDGTGFSPWSKSPIDNDYIRQEGAAGRMGSQLYLVALKRRGGFDFRSPTAEDEKAAEAAEKEMLRCQSAWEAEGLALDEEIPVGKETHDHGYGVCHWRDFFSPRQRLALGTALDELRKVQKKVQEELPKDRAEAVGVYLAIAFDKACDYNSRMVRWHTGRQVVTNTFDRHDFSFKWSHAEFDASRNLFSWVVGQVTDAYGGIAKLAGNKSSALSLHVGSAASIRSIKPGSIDLVCVDPPYYDNVIYSELSNFFYVWLKRSVAHLLPGIFHAPLANTEDEAVANSARFVSEDDRQARVSGGKIKRKRAEGDEKTPDEQATEDYERKMAAAFREARRVLTQHGVLTVMFTNKKVQAWDALARGLIEAGFTIDSSWPVNTESSNSLHLANKSAAQSTIILACRKRDHDGQGRWWDDDFQAEVRTVVRAKAAEYEAQGIGGVDVYLSVFGPVLHLISTAWPVKDPQGGQPIRPERALDLARQAVSDYRFEKLCRTGHVTLEPVTRWYVLAWDIFRALEIPFDEARKLALAVAGDVRVSVTTGKKRQTTKTKDFLEGTLIAHTGLAEKNGSTIKLSAPERRARDGKIDLGTDSFEHSIDAVHAAMVLQKQDGLAAVGQFLEKAGLKQDAAFTTTFEALLYAVPRVRPEWQTLEMIRAAHLAKKVKAPPPPENLDLFELAQKAKGRLSGEGVGDADPEDEGTDGDDS